MHGNSGETQPHFELPPTVHGAEDKPERPIEGLPAPETKNLQKQPVVTVQDDQATSVLPPAPDAAQDGSISVQTDRSQRNRITPIADSDRIDKEWIDRTKDIIAGSHDDPHRQKSEISREKAEYIKRRFDKSIPTDDTVAV